MRPFRTVEGRQIARSISRVVSRQRLLRREWLDLDCRLVSLRGRLSDYDRRFSR